MSVLGVLILTIIIGGTFGFLYVKQRDRDQKRDNDKRLLRSAYLDVLSALRYSSDAFRSADCEFRSSSGVERGLISVVRLRSMDSCQKAHAAATALHELLAGHGIHLAALPELPASLTGTALPISKRDRPKTT